MGTHKVNIWIKYQTKLSQRQKFHQKELAHLHRGLASLMYTKTVCKNVATNTVEYFAKTTHCLPVAVIYEWLAAKSTGIDTTNQLCSGKYVGLLEPQDIFAMNLPPLPAVPLVLMKDWRYTHHIQPILIV